MLRPALGAIRVWWLRLRLSSTELFRLPPIDRARSLLQLARLCNRRGQPVQAETCCAEALGILEHLVRPDHSLIATALSLQSNLLADREQYQAASEVGRRVLSIRESALGPHHPQALHALLVLGHLHTRIPDFEGAATCFRQLIERLEQTSRIDFRRLGEASALLARTMCDLERGEEAEMFYQRSRAAYETADGPLCDGARQAVYGLFWVNFALKKDLPTAERHLKRLRALECRRFGRMSRELIPTLLNLGWVRLDLERNDLAEHVLRGALRIEEQTAGDDDESMAGILHALAFIHEGRGQIDEAESRLRGAIDLLGGPAGPPSQTLARCYLLLFDLHLRRKEPLRALESVEPLCRMARQGLLDDGLDELFEGLDTCAGMLDAESRPDEAEALRREVDRLRNDTRPS